MFTDRSTRRGFGARLAVLLPGLGFVGMTGETLASAAQGTGTVSRHGGLPVYRAHEADELRYSPRLSASDALRYLPVTLWESSK
jgi:hypothetical protein